MGLTMVDTTATVVDTDTDTVLADTMVDTDPDTTVILMPVTTWARGPLMPNPRLMLMPLSCTEVTTVPPHTDMVLADTDMVSADTMADTEDTTVMDTVTVTVMPMANRLLNHTY